MAHWHKPHIVPARQGAHIIVAFLHSNYHSNADEGYSARIIQVTPELIYQDWFDLVNNQHPIKWAYISTIIKHSDEQPAT